MKVENLSFTERDPWRDERECIFGRKLKRNVSALVNKEVEIAQALFLPPTWVTFEC